MAEYDVDYLGKIIIEESPYSEDWGQPDLLGTRRGGKYSVNHLGSEIKGDPEGELLTFRCPKPGESGITPPGGATPSSEAVDPFYETVLELDPKLKPGKSYRVLKTLEIPYRDSSDDSKKAHILVLYCGESGGP